MKSNIENKQESIEIEQIEFIETPTNLVREAVREDKEEQVKMIVNKQEDLPVI